MRKINLFNIFFLIFLSSYFLAYDLNNNKNYIMIISSIIVGLFIIYIFLYSAKLKLIFFFVLISSSGFLLNIINPSINNKELNIYINDIVSYLKFQEKIFFNKENSLNNIISFDENKINHIYILFSVDEDNNLYKYHKGKINIVEDTNIVSHIIYAKNESKNKYYFSSLGSKIFLKNNNKFIKQNLKFHHWPHITENMIYVPSYDYSLKNKENFRKFLNLSKKAKNLKNCHFEFKNLPNIDAVEIFDKNLKKIEQFQYLFILMNDEEIRDKLFFNEKNTKHDEKTFCGDFLHLNFIYELKEKDTRKLKGSEKGDLLLTFRSFDGVILINPNKRKVIFNYQIYKSRPHSGFINYNGNLVLFDNTSKEVARILEIDPSSKKILGEFKNRSLPSATRGLIYQIEKNNYLILYNNSGKIVYLECKDFINSNCKFKILVDSYNQISGMSINY